MQAYYDVSIALQLTKQLLPTPKVKSAVIKCTRNIEKELPCDEREFKLIVKTAFNQRRKTLRNALKASIINLRRIPISTKKSRTVFCK